MIACLRPSLNKAPQLIQNTSSSSSCSFRACSMASNTIVRKCSSICSIIFSPIFLTLDQSGVSSEKQYPDLGKHALGSPKSHSSRGLKVFLQIGGACLNFSNEYKCNKDRQHI